MALVELASLERLIGLYERSKNNIVCTPFYSRDGLGYIQKKSKHFDNLDFITTGSVYTWAQGSANLDHLADFLRHLRDYNVELKVNITSKLHAKIYGSRDKLKCYLGSANLSSAAFNDNFEIMTYLEDKECYPALEIVEEIKSDSPEINVENFLEVIELCSPTIEKVHTRMDETNFGEDDDFIAAVQLVSEHLQKKVKRPTPKKSTPNTVAPDKTGNLGRLGGKWPGLEEFIEYCSALNEKDAKEIVKRYHGKSNLQGHIKHMFYGCLFFFYENPEMIRAIPKNLLNREKVMWSEETWTGPWNQYLKKHANEFYTDIDFNYYTLINYLPTTLGGVQVSGGASSGNFKKVMFFLSKMLNENY